MGALFFQTKHKFLRASQERFTSWGEANNYRRVGAAIEEFYDLFVIHSSYFQRLRWIRKPKPVRYRQEQIIADSIDRWFGKTPYGKMVCELARHGYKPLSGGGWLKDTSE